jgi:hypothetical protein
MTKIVHAAAPKTTREAAKGVKRVRTPDGGYANTIVSASSTLSSDLSYVFKANVKKVSGKR